MGEQVAAGFILKDPEREKHKEGTREGDRRKTMKNGFNGGLAQLGEHLPCKQGVESSNLLVSICSIIPTGSTAGGTLKTEY